MRYGYSDSRLWLSTFGAALGFKMSDKPQHRKFQPIYLCLVIPFVALLWVPFYNRLAPELFGIPFFYWYQTLWTFLGTACTIPVYLYEGRERK